MEELIRKENEQANVLHARLGLVYELYPTPRVDDREVMEISETKLDNELKARQEVQQVADSLKQVLLDEDIKNKMK